MSDVKTWNNISGEQIDAIVESLKRGVRDSHRASVKYACKQILGIESKIHPRVVERVAAILVGTGEYLKEPGTQNTNDLDIVVNPAYKPPSWTDMHPILWEVIKGGITAIFSIIVSVILSIKILSPKVPQESNKHNTESVEVTPQKIVIRDTVYLSDSMLKKRH
ncbi:MAG: hypothetical protein KG003_09095 [Bacteroidetes bacterium]|nr:hypothetical protein [Bacteroidota bacterium]